MDIGTPYKGHSHFKGTHGGVDCGQLLAAVFVEVGLLPSTIWDTIPTDYSLQAAQHSASTDYVDKISEYMRPISESEVLPGDVVVYRLGHAFAHAGLILDWPENIIHAMGGTHGVCSAHGIKTPKFSKAPRIFFTIKDEFC